MGEAGALLVTPGGRRVHCFCVRTTEPDLPPSDRIAHLLLAPALDEEGFATVANHAFAAPLAGAAAAAGSSGPRCDAGDGRPRPVAAREAMAWTTS